MSKRSGDTNTGRSSGSRRDEILSIAAKVISERGIAGATVRDIGAEAGILSGSLYHHFSSKDEIVLDLLEPVLQHQIDRYREIASRDLAPSAALPELLSAAVHEAQAKPYETLIIRNDSHLFATVPAFASLESLRQAARSSWLDTVRSGIERGAFRDTVDPDVVVGAMFDAVRGSVRWFTQRRPANPAVVAGALSDLFLRGISR